MHFVYNWAIAVTYPTPGQPSDRNNTKKEDCSER